MKASLGILGKAVITTLLAPLVAFGADWSNVTFPRQTGSFVASFDVVPGTNNMDGVIGLAPAAASSYTHLAAIVRFAPDGRIDVRNGGVYGKQVNLPYSAGGKYRIRMNVNVRAKTYSVSVTPPGRSAVTIASNYAFRTEQARATSLSQRASISAVGSMTISNFSVVAATTPTPTPAPTPIPATPTPAPTPSPTATPPSGEYAAKPTAANTGWAPTGVRLVASGSITITQDGTVVDGRDISGNVVIQASNVTIRRSRVRTTYWYPIWVKPGAKNVVIEDVEVDGMGGGSKGILVDAGASVLIQRCNIHDNADGLSLNGFAGIIIKNNYVHTPRQDPDAHHDAFEVYGGGNMLIQNNNFDYRNAATSAGFFASLWDHVTDITFDHNWLAGGAISLRVQDSPFSSYLNVRIRITNNRFMRGTATYATHILDLPRSGWGVVTWQGNVYDDNDQLVAK